MRSPKPETWPPEWLVRITRKRGGEIALLVMQLVIEGRRKGSVTAEDAHHIAVSQPNCRGAAMKYLARCGFVKQGVAAATTKQSHGHTLFEWRLECGVQAERMQRALAETMLSQAKSNAVAAGPMVQMEML